MISSSADSSDRQYEPTPSAYRPDHDRIPRFGNAPILFEAWQLRRGRISRRGGIVIYTLCDLGLCRALAVFNQSPTKYIRDGLSLIVHAFARIIQQAAIFSIFTKIARANGRVPDRYHCVCTKPLSEVVALKFSPNPFWVIWGLKYDDVTSFGSIDGAR